MKKRFKSISVVIAMVMALSFIAPSAVLAHHHYYYPYHHHHHWSSGRAWGWGLGILALSWLTNVATNRPYASAYGPVVYTYEDARTSFINSLDEKEFLLFKEINALAPNSPGHRYIYEYGQKDVTRRRLQKIMTNLSDEYLYEFAQDGRVFFRKLK